MINNKKIELYLYIKNQPTKLVDLLGLKEKDPCAEVEKLYPSGVGMGELGVLACHNGELIGCVWGKDTKPVYKLYPGILKCVQAHEDLHVKQNQGWIDCEPCETYFPSSEELHHWNEFEAHILMVSCLFDEHTSACGTQYDHNKPISEMSQCEFAFFHLISSAYQAIDHHGGQL